MAIGVPIILLTLLVFIPQSFKATKILRIYHQEDYDLKLTILEVVSYNHSYFRDVRAGMFYFNRTQRVINGSGYLLADLSKNMRMNYQLYKFISNEYRFFPLTINFDACEEFDRNTMGIAKLLKKHSNVRGCPLKKGFYYFNNIHHDPSQLPPYIPRGEVHCYGTVLDKPIKWEN